MNLRQMINLFLQKTGTTLTSNLSQAKVIDYLNQARLTMVTESLIGVQRTFAFPGEADQEFYNLPDDWLAKNADTMYYKRINKVEFVDKKTFLDQRQFTGTGTGNLPRIWTVYDGQLRVWPATSASPSTTVATAFGGGSDATGIYVNNDAFPTTGILRQNKKITVDSLDMNMFEFIGYGKKTLAGPNMELTVLRRGLQDTGVGFNPTVGEKANLCEFEIDYYSKGKNFLVTPIGGVMALANGGSLVDGEAYQVGITINNVRTGQYGLLKRLGSLTATSTDKTIAITNLPVESVSGANRISVLTIYMTEGNGDLFFSVIFKKLSSHNITTVLSAVTPLTQYEESTDIFTPTVERHSVLTTSGIPEKYDKAQVFMACKELAEDKREWDLANTFTINFNDAMEKAQSIEWRDQTRKENQMKFIEA